MPRRVVGLYPARLWHRRNTDYLYHYALKDLYARMELPFEIVEGFGYNLAATLFYQMANRIEGVSPRVLHRWRARWWMRMPLPRRYLGNNILYHGSVFALPANVRGNLVMETEFYDFDCRAGNPPFQVNGLKDSDLARLRSIIVRSALSRDCFLRQYPEEFHHLPQVAPFYMPYLARWEGREPVKPAIADGLVFIFAGNQARRKGLDLYIRLAAEIRRLAPRQKFTFLVVSNFQDGENFDLAGMQVYRGQTGEAVQDLMERAHFLVLPTRRDSHPKVCYEAAALGCGLILSDTRPVADVWAGRARIFPLSGGDEALAAVAADVVEERLDPVGMGRENRSLFLSEFCPSASAGIHRKALFGRNP